MSFPISAPPLEPQIRGHFYWALKGTLSLGYNIRSRDAIQSTAALTEESNRRFATSESQLKLVGGAASALADTVGDQLAPTIVALAGELKDTLVSLNDFAEANPNLTKTIVVLTGALGVGGLAGGGLLFGVSAVTNAVIAARPALAFFQGQLLATGAAGTTAAVGIRAFVAALGPIGLAVGGATLLIALQADESRSSQKELRQLGAQG